MSIKVYNEGTGKWEIQSSKMAITTEVIDAKENFEANDVERCLEEIQDNLGDVRKKVDYIYKNGTLGGGGGGGGGILPILTVYGDDEYNVTSNQVLTIEYEFSSANAGTGTATLTDNNSIKQVSGIRQNVKQRWTVGPFEKRKEPYWLSIRITDSQGFSSETKQIKVITGALELTINNDFDTQDFLPEQEVDIFYTLDTTMTNAAITVRKSFYGFSEPITTTESAGPNRKWTIKLPNGTGLYTGYIEAALYDLVVKVPFRIVVSDSTDLLITSSYPEAPEIISIPYDSDFYIDYRISKRNEPYFNAKFTLTKDGKTVKEESRNSIIGSRSHNYILGKLDLGDYDFKIVATTVNGDKTTEKKFKFQVVTYDFEPFTPVEHNLIGYYDSSGKNATDQSAAIWENKIIGNSNMYWTLYKFNQTSNGWKEVKKLNDIPTVGAKHGIYPPENRKENVLKFSGKTYAILENYTPLSGGLLKGNQGLTVEAIVRVKNTGDNEAKVLSCMETLKEKVGTEEVNRSICGFEIGVGTATIKLRSGGEASVKFNEDEWVRISFVIDRNQNEGRENFIKIYINGILSAYTPIIDKANESVFSIPNQIVLGAKMVEQVEKNDLDQIISVKRTFENYANAEIKLIRIYDAPLGIIKSSDSKDEIVQNYIADIRNSDEQLFLRRVNGEDKGFENTIPIVELFTDGNVDIEANNPVGGSTGCSIKYTDPIRPDKVRDFSNTCKIEWQGTSSTDYPVKNYTIILIENNQPYYGWTPRDEWRPESRWTLKANYMDSSQANNIGACKFINSFMVYPPLLDKPNCRSCPDGFPIKLYLNGSFKGIYTFNIDRYAFNNYGFVEYYPNEEGGYNSTPNQNIISYEINSNSAEEFTLDFSEANADISWERVRRLYKHRYSNIGTPTTLVPVEGQPNVTTTVLSDRNQHPSLFNLLRWISSFRDTPDERARFNNELKRHFSIPHLIDYFLVANMLGACDNLSKNMVITTYGRDENQDEIWYPQFYDLDSLLGLDNTGNNNITPGLEMGMDNGFTCDKSRLWTWFVEFNYKAIKDRYGELRANRLSGNKILPGIFSLENLMSYFAGDVSDTIGHKFYNQDFAYKYFEKDPSAGWSRCAQGSRRSYIEQWIRERLIFLDSYFEYGEFNTRNITMRTYYQGYLTVKIKSFSPQKTKVQFEDGTIEVSTTDKYGYTTFTSPHPILKGNNNFTISGAGNIMEIQGLDKLDIAELNISKASKLIEVSLPGSSRIREIHLASSDVEGESNDYLRKLDFTDCINLGLNHETGAANKNKEINIVRCSNLQELKCKNTKIEGITFPKEGGVLETLELSETLITSFNMTGQEYLENLELKSCGSLKTLKITVCNGLKTLEVPNSIISGAIVTDCRNLESFDISNNGTLNSLTLERLPKLKKVNLSSIMNGNFSTVDLSQLNALEELNIENSRMKYLVFYNWSKPTLKKFNCRNSAIVGIMYGLSSPVPTILDLTPFSFSELNFYNCHNLTGIKGINLDMEVAKRGDDEYKDAIFYSCKNLTSITGKIKLSGKMYHTFELCEKLSTLPELDFSEVSYAQEIFQNCYKLTTSHVRKIMHSFGKTVNGVLKSKLDNCWRMFRGCYNEKTKEGGIPGKINLIDNVANDLFKNVPNLTRISEIFQNAHNLEGELTRDLFKPIEKNLQRMAYSFQNTRVSINFNEYPKFFSIFPNLKEAHFAFQGCSNMKTFFASNVFEGCPLLENVEEMFSVCTNMVGTITMDYNNLFANKKNLTNVYGFIRGCSSLRGVIPPKIFDTNNGKQNNLKYPGQFFNSVNINEKPDGFDTYIPPNILSLCTNATNVYGLFANLKNIDDTIPPDIFKGLDKIQDAGAFFQGCSKLKGEIPKDLFKPLSSLTKVNRFFKDCPNITGNIPIGLLDNNPNITHVAGLFSGCKGLTGEIPARISTFEYGPEDESGYRPVIEKVTQYGIFDKVKFSEYADEIFYNCQGLTGKIPPKLFYNGGNIKNTNFCFGYCINLIGGIPSELFSKCSMLETTESMFTHCYSIANTENDSEAELISKDLFANCPKLMSIVSMFDCKDGMPGWPVRIYGTINPDAFINNTNLKNINRAFRNTKVSGDLNNRLFSNCKKLESGEETFSGANILSTGKNLFNSNTHQYLTNLKGCFRSNTNLKSIFNIDENSVNKITNRTGCFAGCTTLLKDTALKAQLEKDGWL